MIALPKWVLLRTLPVIPAAFRPWSDDRPFKLNTLYSHVLKAAQDVRSARTSTDARAAIKRRALETAVSRLIGFKARHQGSLSGMLGGKHGLLRQELLGRRVDQSARAVIVPAPHLALNSVELPAPIFDATAGQSPGGREDSLVLLNRAPSLHRYSIHASRPIRCDGQHVIGLHPLVCGGLNADFDGDTVAVHGVGQGAGVAEAESMLPGRHPLSVASGRFLLHMTQDIVSGLYLACGMAEFGGGTANAPADARVDIHYSPAATRSDRRTGGAGSEGS